MKSDASSPAWLTRPDFIPSDHGLISQAYDVALAASGLALTTAGTVYVVKIHIPEACNVTNLHVYVFALGNSLTSGQCFAGLYQGGTLLGTTADQATAWNSTGFQTMAIAGGAVPVIANRKPPDNLFLLCHDVCNSYFVAL